MSRSDGFMTYGLTLCSLKDIRACRTCPCCRLLDYLIPKTSLRPFNGIVAKHAKHGEQAKVQIYDHSG